MLRLTSTTYYVHAIQITHKHINDSINITADMLVTAWLITKYLPIATVYVFAALAMYVRPVARNFNWVVLLYKIVDLFNKIVDFLS